MDGKIVLIAVLLFASAFAAPAPQADDLLCELCHIMVRDLKSMLGENATEAEVEGAIDNICNRLASGQDKCTSMVHQYLPPLFDKISGNLDPESACQVLEVCPAQMRIEHSPPDALRQIPKVVEKKIETKEVEASNNTCNLCQFVIQYLDAELTVNATETEINVTLLKVCSQFDSLSTILGDLCRQIEPRIMLQVKNGLIDSQKACVYVKLCDQMWKSNTEDLPRANETPEEPLVGLISVETNNAVQHIMEKNKKGKPVVWKRQVDASNITCDVCEFLMEILDTVLENNRSEPMVNDTLWKACDALYNGLVPPLGIVCYQMEPNILKAIEAGADPEKVCFSIRLCPTISRVVSIEDLTCDVCKSLLMEVAGKAGEEVCNRMQGVCVQAGKKVPKSLVSEVDNYVDGILKSEPVEEEEENYVEPEQHQIEEEEEEIEEEPEGEPEANPIECAVCRFLVDELEKRYLRNKTEGAINTTIYTLCNDLPESIQPFCFHLAPTIVNFLINDVADPSKLCADLKLCDATVENEKLLEEMKESYEEQTQVEANPVECSICKVIVDELEKRLANNKSESAINATIYEVCNDLPASVQPLCISNAPRIVSFVVKEMNTDPSTLCTVIRLCDANETKTSFQQEKLEEEVMPEEMIMAPEGEECEACKFIVNLIDQWLITNKSAAVVNSTIYNFCNSLPAEFKTLCMTVAPELIKALEHGFNATSACISVKFCNANGTFTSPLSKSLLTNILQTTEENEGGILECQTCRILLTVVDELVRTNSSKEYINTTLFEGCQILPSEVQQFCFELIPKLFQEIENGWNATYLCERFKACSVNSTYAGFIEKEVEEPELELETEPAVVEDDPKCQICKLFVQLINAYIDRNTSADTINSTVYKLCDSLPSDLKGTCSLFAPSIVKAVQKGLSPGKACADVKLCSNGTIPVIEEPVEEINEEVGDTYCEVCKLVVRNIDAYIGKNKSQAAINSSMEHICDKIPADLKYFCELLKPTLIKDIENGLDPQKTCTEVKLCTNGSMEAEEKEEIPPQELEKEVTVGADARCELCKFFIQLIDNELKKGTVLEKLNGTLTAVCSLLPFNSTCKEIVPVILNSVAAGVAPDKACQAVNYCSNDTLLQAHFLSCKTCHGIIELMNPEEYNPQEADATCNMVCSRRHRRSARKSSQMKQIITNFKKGDVNLGQTWDCSVCEFLSQTANVLLTDNHTEGSVENVLKNVCKYLPSPYNSACMSSAVEIIHEIEHGFDSREICSKMTGDSCDNASSMVRNFLEEFGKPELWECNFCVKVLNFVNDALDKDTNQVNMYIENVCERLPAPTNQACRQFIHTQSNEVVYRIINQLLNPTKICQMVHICPANQHHPNDSTL